MINWEVTTTDRELIKSIVERACGLDVRTDKLSLSMDITACHANGCPLDLVRLRDAPDFDFAHDILGITQHIDRGTGKLADCFLPRCNRRLREVAT